MAVPPFTLRWDAIKYWDQVVSECGPGWPKTYDIRKPPRSWSELEAIWEKLQRDTGFTGTALHRAQAKLWKLESEPIKFEDAFFEEHGL